MSDKDKRYFCRDCGKPMLRKDGGCVASYHLCPDENCRGCMDIKYDYFHGDRTSFHTCSEERYPSYKTEGFVEATVDVVNAKKSDPWECSRCGEGLSKCMCH